MASNGCGCGSKVSTPSTGSVDSTTSNCGCAEPAATQVLVSGIPIQQSCCAPQTCCSTGTQPVTACSTTLVAVGDNVTVGKGVVVPVSKQTGGTNKTYYKHSLKILNSFNIPLLNGKANVAIEQTKGIAPGTIIFNELVGWLKVTSFDETRNTIDIQNFLAPSVSDVNPSVTYNEVGKLVDACTEFAVGTPDYNAGSSSSSQNCLLTDFFSPAVDVTGTTTVTVELSNVDGILIGSRLSIGSYEYVVKTVVSATVVEIYNAGAGAPAGTKVVGGKDCSDNCLTVVTILAADNPCEKTAVQEGVILVCDGQDIKPFTAVADNSVPVWDAVTETWKPEILSIDTGTCTALTADFTIDNVGSTFVATVGSTVGFSAGGVNSLVKLDNGLFKITSIIDATHMRLDPIVTPGGVIVYPTGMTICVASCCDCPSASRLIFFSDDNLSSVDVTSVATVNICQTAVTFSNPSNCQRANVLLYIRFGGGFRLDAGGTFQLDITDGTNLLYTQLIDTNAGSAFHQDHEWVLPWRPVYPGSGVNGILGRGESYGITFNFDIRTTNSPASASNITNGSLVVEGLIVTESI